MRCHYDVLNVSRDADDAEIKAAYKKLALKWHPDKNIEDYENAHEQFLYVQQAYEVLSDKQERAWYDRHRDQILYGAKTEFADNSLDVFQYFTTSCFNGYNDNEDGFYTVYRNVFDQIAKEEMDFCEDKEEFRNIPSFGTSTSDYEATVQPFYAYWMSYSTKKPYFWLNPYNVEEIRERRLFKAVEKENKKVRQKAKKERNEEIRNLVTFVRKRDRRVQAWNKSVEVKNEVRRRKQEEMRKQKLEERRLLNQSEVQAEWTKFENVSSELREIEKHLEKEFGNSDLSDSEDESDLYCAACNKLFKTEKSFQNHESSKKHRENVEFLKAQMLEEDAEYESIESDADLEKESLNEEIPREPSNERRPLSTAEKELSSSEEEVEVSAPRRKKKGKSKMPNNNDSPSSDASLKNEVKKPQKNKKSRIVLKVDSTDDERLLSTLPASSSSENDFNVSKKGKRKNRKAKPKKAQKSSILEEKASKVNPVSSLETPNENKTEENEPELHICSTCQKDYPSKNKLFQHLRKEGHSIYLPKGSEKENSKSSKKK